MSEKIDVARTSAIAGGTLALLKLSIGVLSGSLALISEGIHSSLDFAVTIVTWLTVRSSDTPADREHHYGHGKIENLSAFAQALFLIVTAFWITIEAYHHITEPMPEASAAESKGWWAAIAVVAVSLVVDFTRARALSRAAKKFNSQALEADALHFGTELLSSAVVLAGLLVVKFGGPRFRIADPLAAIAVAGVMLFTALRLGRKAADVLIDRAPDGVEDAVQRMVREVPGVRDVSRVRARQSGASTFVDATIVVDPTIGLQAGHDISDAVELRVTESYPGLDIFVHVEPDAPAENHVEVIRYTAEALRIRLHAIRVRDIDGHLYIAFHAEFPPEMTLAEAHRQVTGLEERIREKLHRVAEIDSHLEPMGA